MPQVVGGEGVADGRCFEAGSRTAGQEKNSTEAEVGELKSGRALGQQGEWRHEIGCMGSIVSLLSGLAKGGRRSKECWGWRSCVWEEHGEKDMGGWIFSLGNTGRF